jgi:aspartate aminotransferase-like enzyme
VVRETSDALVVVDAITALGVIPLPMDAWGLDAVVSGSQKALMLPPGLACLALSERAQKARERSNIPRFYYDLAAEDKAAAKGETAWTPAVGLIQALDVVLTRLRESGLEPVFTHHRRLAEATRRGVKALGLELFSRGIPSTAVTAVHVPKAIPEGKKIVSHLRDRFGVTIAGGQDAWAGKIFRLAHLGHYDELDMLTILSPLGGGDDPLQARLPVRAGQGRGGRRRLLRGERIRCTKRSSSTVSPPRASRSSRPSRVSRCGTRTAWTGASSKRSCPTPTSSSCDPARKWTGTC